jgi:hypothetical protein
MEEKEVKSRQGNAAMVSLIPANGAHRFHGVGFGSWARLVLTGLKASNFIKRPKTN